MLVHRLFQQPNVLSHSSHCLTSHLPNHQQVQHYVFHRSLSNCSQCTGFGMHNDSSHNRWILPHCSPYGNNRNNVSTTLQCIVVGTSANSISRVSFDPGGWEPRGMAQRRSQPIVLVIRRIESNFASSLALAAGGLGSSAPRFDGHSLPKTTTSSVVNSG